jgi:hypothetical protein
MLDGLSFIPCWEVGVARTPFRRISEFRKCAIIPNPVSPPHYSRNRSDLRNSFIKSVKRVKKINLNGADQELETICKGNL